MCILGLSHLVDCPRCICFAPSLFGPLSRVSSVTAAATQKDEASGPWRMRMPVLNETGGGVGLPTKFPIFACARQSGRGKTAAGAFACLISCQPAGRQSRPAAVWGRTAHFSRLLPHPPFSHKSLAPHWREFCRRFVGGLTPFMAYLPAFGVVARIGVVSVSLLVRSIFFGLAEIHKWENNSARCV